VSQAVRIGLELLVGVPALDGHSASETKTRTTGTDLSAAMLKVIPSLSAVEAS